MKYSFYPGCSADASALEYKTTTLAILEALGATVGERGNRKTLLREQRCPADDRKD